ncbi:MAG: cytochrome c maturation protein CcmE [Burkholderiales bacterium]
MKPRHKKFLWVVGGLALLGVGVALVLNALKTNLNYFYTPTQVANHEAPSNRSFRIGGLVMSGSLKRQTDGLTVEFVVTDTARNIPVIYKGILPDLFQEGKGVVAQGKLGANGYFIADQVLAKHDENYMPPEAAKALLDAQKAKALAGKTLKP